MSESGRKSPESISGKDISKLSDTLLQKVIRLVLNGKETFVSIRKKSSLDSVKITVSEIIELMDNLASDLEEIGKEGWEGYSNQDEEIREMEMLDHLISEEKVTDPNDLKSVLLEIMKVNRNIHSVVSLIAAEYTNPAMRGMFSSILDGLVIYKNRVEELYDELVNKDFW